MTAAAVGTLPDGRDAEKQMREPPSGADAKEKAAGAEGGEKADENNKDAAL